MHAEQIAAFERVREKAERKGVDLGIEWLGYDYDWRDHRLSKGWILDDAAALIVTGALSKWLAGQGIAVIYSSCTVGWYTFDNLSDKPDEPPITRLLQDATDHLSALIAATLARLDELPDAAAESQPARKEPPQ